MKDREMKQYLRETLGREVKPRRMEETVDLCIRIMGEKEGAMRGPRTGFFQYLSDVFRYEGGPILGFHGMTLLIVCLMLSGAGDVPKNIPVFMPLFVLALLPALFKGQYFHMSEIESVTRASGAQITLAKLIIAGGANLVCITVVLGLMIYLQNSCLELGQMVLYCLVPYLSCMTVLLCIIRQKRRESLPVSVGLVFCSCVLWGLLARFFPGLYEASATGIWTVAFVVFTGFFVKEIHYIAVMRKEGKMYGIVA